MAGGRTRAIRGATLNGGSARFGLPAREADGDWLDACRDVDGEAPPVRTSVTVEHPRTIISRNTSPDVPFDRSINPYRGCEHVMSGHHQGRTSSEANASIIFAGV